VVEVREPGQPPRRLPFEEAAVEFGRECAGVILSDPGVSRRHLQFDSGPDGLMVVDLGSSNGTTVNGDRLTAPAALAVGDVVALGGTEIRVVEIGPPPALPGPGVEPGPATPPTRAPSVPSWPACAGPRPPMPSPLLRRRR